MPDPTDSQRMPVKLKLVAVVGVSLMFAAVLFAWFAQTYHSVSWFLDPPPNISVAGRNYKPSSFPPSTNLPVREGIEWEVKGHMWPLGYDIYGARGYPTPVEMELEWRDGSYYQYSLQGGP